jgi:hypothetical protein
MMSDVMSKCNCTAMCDTHTRVYRGQQCRSRMFQSNTHGHSVIYKLVSDGSQNFMCMTKIVVGVFLSDLGVYMT